MIITNFDDILPGNVTQLMDNGTAPLVTSPDYGAFGNGIAGSSIGFNVQRFDDFPVNSNVKTKVSALCRLPWLGTNTGGNVGFMVGAVGFVRASAVDISSNFLLSAIYDGRNSTASSSSMFQVRANNMGTLALLYSSSNTFGTIVRAGTWTRIEVTVELTGDGTQQLCTIEWINHGTGELMRRSQHTRARIDDLRPHIAPYNLAHFDNVQFIVGDEPYISNVPVKIRIGDAWVKKPMKKLKSGVWVPAYPRVQKNGQNLW